MLVRDRWPIDPGRLRLFDLERPRVSSRTVLELGERLGLKGGRREARLESTEAAIRYGAGSELVTVYRASGAVRYQDLARWQVDDGSDAAMTDEDAFAAARRYIEVKELASVREMEPATVTRLRVGHASVDGREHEERVVDLGVVFRRVVEGLPVDGPGGQLTVYLNAAGEVTGVDRTWRPVAGVRDQVKGIRTAENVFAGARRIFGPNLAPTEVRFGYFEEGPRRTQRVLQPVFVVILAPIDRENGPGRRAVYVRPAATNSVGRLQPARRRRPDKPQVRREAPERR